MSKNDLIDCHDRIKPFIHNTPVLTSKLINNLAGADIYFKCENFQKMGAFKTVSYTHLTLPTICSV